MAGITIQPGRYYVGMWLFALPKHISNFGKGGDAMFCLSRDEKEPLTWELVWRFRHARDLRKVWHHDDEKHWYQQTFTGTESEVTKAMMLFMRSIGGLGMRWDHFDIRGDYEKFMRLATSKKAPDWLHMKKMTESQLKTEYPDEFAEIQLEKQRHED
jgi:hypothetical protein